MKKKKKKEKKERRRREYLSVEDGEELFAEIKVGTEFVIGFGGADALAEFADNDGKKDLDEIGDGDVNENKSKKLLARVKEATRKAGVHIENESNEKVQSNGHHDFDGNDFDSMRVGEMAP